MELRIDSKYKDILLEALDDYQYKLALKLNELRGQALTKQRKELTQKQKYVEELKSTMNAL